LKEKKEVLASILLILIVANCHSKDGGMNALFIVRRRRSVSFCLFCGVRTKLFCHLPWTFSDGNRAYLLFFCVMVGMFSSFFLIFGVAKVHKKNNMTTKKCLKLFIIKIKYCFLDYYKYSNMFFSTF